LFLVSVIGYSMFSRYLKLKLSLDWLSCSWLL
jgi:hypothetical protein